MMHTKISLSLERQNQALLKNMDDRSALQLRLQTLVEGLSMFAISYYIFSLVKYAVEPTPGLAGKWTNGAIIGVIVALVWSVIHRRRRKIATGNHP